MNGLHKTRQCKCASKEELDISHLHKDGEEDDGDDGREEHVLHLAFGQQEPQREGDGASQATVGDDELVLLGQLHNTEFIDDERESDDAWNTQETTQQSLKRRGRGGRKRANTN